jgi:hypothetical protein
MQKNHELVRHGRLRFSGAGVEDRVARDSRHQFTEGSARSAEIRSKTPVVIGTQKKLKAVVLLLPIPSTMYVPPSCNQLDAMAIQHGFPPFQRTRFLR